MFSFVFISVNNKTQKVKYDTCFCNPINFLNSKWNKYPYNIIFQKFIPEKQLFFVENNIKLFKDDDENLKTLDNIFIFLNELCYNAFIKENIRIENEDEEELLFEESKKKKIVPVIRQKKKQEIKKYKCFTYDDKPDRNNKRKKIEIIIS